MPLNLSPHIMQKEPGTRIDRIVKVVPYICIMKDDGPNIFLQQGKAYSADGKAIKKEDYPKWFYEELGKLTDHALQEVGWSSMAKKGMREDAVNVTPVKKVGRPKGSKTKKRKRVTRKVESERPVVSETDGDSSTSRDVDQQGSL